jgi:D-cysteine desulfhydrase
MYSNEPERIELANLPTRIEKLKGDYQGVNIYIKRDDQTGFELSGNKVRKLEYTMKAAMDKGCNAVITCGGFQTNHGRATVIAAVKLGLKPYLVLKSDENDVKNGNYFLDELYGAEVIKISAETYKNERNEIMENLKNDLAGKGIRAYVIPEGASNGLGNWGYIRAIKEIVAQEKEMGVTFDYLTGAMGSGSTHAGMILGAHLYETKHKVLGFNIYDGSVDGNKKVYDLIQETGMDLTIDKNRFDIINDYVGKGYAISTPEEIEWIKRFTREEGILLDTVYTGKAFRGLVVEIMNGRFEKGTNILFIHTGGAFGNFSKVDLMLK